MFNLLSQIDTYLTTARNRRIVDPLKNYTLNIDDLSEACRLDGTAGNTVNSYQKSYGNLGTLTSLYFVFPWSHGFY